MRAPYVSIEDVTSILKQRNFAGRAATIGQSLENDQDTLDFQGQRYALLKDAENLLAFAMLGSDLNPTREAVRAAPSRTELDPEELGAADEPPPAETSDLSGPGGMTKGSGEERPALWLLKRRGMRDLNMQFHGRMEIQGYLYRPRPRIEPTMLVWTDQWAGYYGNNHRAVGLGAHYYLPAFFVDRFDELLTRIVMSRPD